MMEYRFATASDIDALIKSRLEMLRIVNDLEDDYVFGEDFVQASRDYFLKGDQITVFALHDSIIVGCGSICFMELMPTFSHPTGKRAHLMNVYTNVAYRRQGIAYKMTTMLIEEAWNRGATEISLDATESGRPLYRKCGFKDSVQKGKARNHLLSVICCREAILLQLTGRLRCSLGIRTMMFRIKCITVLPVRQSLMRFKQKKCESNRSYSHLNR